MYEALVDFYKYGLLYLKGSNSNNFIVDLQTPLAVSEEQILVIFNVKSNEIK